MNEKKTVFVGLSGGVDSSVAALRLKNSGFNVVGVFIKVWHPDWLVCNWEEERLDAMRVAAKLKIPFLTCDAVEAYKQNVADHFIAEYVAGRTPNPDILCNTFVKFGAFLNFAKEAGADFIATGHYVRKVVEDGKDYLYRGRDNNKDQSYFLSGINQEQLNFSLFPVGDTDKTKIRKEAERAGIPTASKKDSQGVCFLGQIDIPVFLSHYTTLTPGDVLNESGAIIGSHRGALVYTLGQRHGFEIINTDNQPVPHFVVARDISKNTITVSTSKPEIGSDQFVEINNFNFISQTCKVGDKLSAQFRYRQSPAPVEIVMVEENQLKLKALETNEQPTQGQTCVLYDQDKMIGGGIIT